MLNQKFNFNHLINKNGKIITKNIIKKPNGPTARIGPLQGLGSGSIPD